MFMMMMTFNLITYGGGKGKGKGHPITGHEGPEWE
jgi:hypothetical protein